LLNCAKVESISYAVDELCVRLLKWLFLVEQRTKRCLCGQGMLALTIPSKFLDSNPKVLLTA
jgi:hypothetical protein